MEIRVDKNIELKTESYGKINVEIPIKKDTEAKYISDVFKWIQQCNDADSLLYVSDLALKRARRIQYPQLHKLQDDK